MPERYFQNLTHYFVTNNTSGCWKPVRVADYGECSDEGTPSETGCNAPDFKQAHGGSNRRKTQRKTRPRAPWPRREFLCQTGLSTHSLLCSIFSLSPPLMVCIKQHTKKSLKLMTSRNRAAGRSPLERQLATLQIIPRPISKSGESTTHREKNLAKAKNENFSSSSQAGFLIVARIWFLNFYVKTPIRSNRIVRSKGQGRNYAHYQRRVYPITDFLSSAKGRPFQSGLNLGLFCTFLLFTLLPLWQHVKRRKWQFCYFRWDRNENNLFAYYFRRHSHSIQFHSAMGKFYSKITGNE